MKQLIYIIAICAACMSVQSDDMTRIGGMAGVNIEYRLERAKSGVGTGRILYYTIGADGRKYAWTEGDEAFANRTIQAHKEFAKKQQEAKIALQQRLALESIQYNNQKLIELPETQKRVMKFRLEQATNGSTMYQLRVSTNYLFGTDGFPLDTNLAKYWYNKATATK